MYFIASGLVEVTLGQTRAHLGEGGFFGEMAVLGDRQRVATVTAESDARLLVLEAQDLHALMARKSDLARRILDEVRQRRGAPSGDILAEEVAEAEDMERADAAGADETLPDLFSDLPEAAGPDTRT